MIAGTDKRGPAFRQRATPSHSRHPGLSIVIPVRNDADVLSTLLAYLKDTFELPDPAVEVIVVDGRSQDDSAAIATAAGATVVSSPPGRGRQLNAGWRHATGEMIWMLHADCRPDAGAIDWMRRFRAIGWGRFDVSFNGQGWAMGMVGALMNGRSRLTGICTGDQAIFVHRRLLERIGGIPEQPLMEDIELSRRLAHLCAPNCQAATVETSDRRWRNDGWLTTVLSMWRFRLRYWSGATPETLAREYYGKSD